jgi:hypothetical protein
MANRRVWLVIGLVSALVIVGGALAARGLLAGPAPSTAPAHVVIESVTSAPDGSLTAVGGTAVDGGDAVIARSSDAGAHWQVSSAAAPGFISVAAPGEDLVAAQRCLADSISGVPIGPAPASCLYASGDGGATWTDLGAGRLADPSFADSAYGWAHAQFPTGRELYESADTGRSWSKLGTPCPADKPLIYSAVSTGTRTGYVLCFAQAEDTQPWSLVERSADGQTTDLYDGEITGREPQAGLKDDFVQGMSMRFDGSGMIWTSSGLYQTSDGGRTWTAIDVSGLDQGSFQGGGSVLDGGNAYLVRRSNTTSVVAYRDDALTTLISWPLSLAPK